MGGGGTRGGEAQREGDLFDESATRASGQLGRTLCGRQGERGAITSLVCTQRKTIGMRQGNF